MSVTADELEASYQHHLKVRAELQETVIAEWPREDERAKRVRYTTRLNSALFKAAVRLDLLGRPGRAAELRRMTVPTLFL